MILNDILGTCFSIICVINRTQLPGCHLRFNELELVRVVGMVKNTELEAFSLKTRMPVVRAKH